MSSLKKTDQTRLPIRVTTDSELIAHQLDFLLSNGNEMLEAMFLLKENLMEPTPLPLT